MIFKNIHKHLELCKYKKNKMICKMILLMMMKLEKIDQKNTDYRRPKQNI